MVYKFHNFFTKIIVFIKLHRIEIALVVIGFFLRILYDILRPVQINEINDQFVLNQSFEDIFNLAKLHFQQPAYYYFVKIITEIFNYNIYFIRIIATGLWLFSIVSSIKLIKIFNKKLIRLMLILSYLIFMPVSINISTISSPFVIASVLSVFSFFYYFKIRQNLNRKNIIIYLILSLLNIFVSVAGLMIVLSVFCYELILILIKKITRDNSKYNKNIFVNLFLTILCLIYFFCAGQFNTLINIKLTLIPFDLLNISGFTSNYSFVFLVLPILFILNIILNFRYVDKKKLKEFLYIILIMIFFALLFQEIDNLNLYSVISLFFIICAISFVQLKQNTITKISIIGFTIIIFLQSLFIAFSFNNTNEKNIKSFVSEINNDSSISAIVVDNSKNGTIEIANFYIKNKKIYIDKNTFSDQNHIFPDYYMRYPQDLKDSFYYLKYNEDSGCPDINNFDFATDHISSDTDFPLEICRYMKL